MTHPFESMLTQVLEEAGIVLDDSLKATYMPQLLGQLDERIGYTLVPKIKESHEARFAELVDAEDTDQATWAVFWKEAVDDFEGVVGQVLKDFVEEMKGILVRTA